MKISNKKHGKKHMIERPPHSCAIVVSWLRKDGFKTGGSNTSEVVETLGCVTKYILFSEHAV